VATGQPALWHTYFEVDGERVTEDHGAAGALTHYYYQNDYQNSIGMVTDDNFNPAAPAEKQNEGFDAFGNPRLPSGATDPTWGANGVTKRGYINQEHLTDVRLIDLNARVFDPCFAEFLSPAPIIEGQDDSQSWNGYAYSHNNPMSKEDPTGLEPTEQDYSSPQSQLAASEAQEDMSAGPLNIGAFAQAAAQAFDLQAAGQIAQAVGLSGLGKAGWSGSGEPTFTQGGKTYTQTDANDVSAMVSGMHGAASGQGGVRLAQGPAEENRLTPETVPEAEAADRAQEQLDAEYAIATGKAKLPTGPTYLSAPGDFPPNGGFLSEPTTTYLYPGDRIDGYGGSEFSRYFSPEGTPPEQRSLPPESAGRPLNRFVVQKPFPVQSGPAAPYYNQPGMGTQYRAPVSLGTLLLRGIISPAY
jgi:RHS repeat-associated protein